MSFTYAQLKTAIQDYAENDETSFVNNLPVFIRQAEERILKNVQLSFFRKNVSGNMAQNNQYLACPSDFLTAGAESATTWLSENSQMAMLYGSLIEAYIYMKGEPDVMAQYEKRFAEAMMGMRMLGENKEVTDDYRTGMLVRPKQ